MTRKAPVTQAVRMLRRHEIDFTSHLYNYEEKGGTSVSARELGVDEHLVVKTLAMENENGDPLLVLMHGDREVSTKNLARELATKLVQPCPQDTVQKHTGYQPGGTSPFATKKELPVYAEASIFDLERIYINGGNRGFLVGLDPAVLEQLLPLKKVNVAVEQK